MKRQSLMEDYLGALWNRFFLGILTAIDVVGLLVVLCTVVDDWYELVAMLVLGAVWFWSGLVIFKKQQERITQLEARLATEERSINAALAMLKEEIDRNLEALALFWERIDQLSEPSSEPTQKRLALARQAIELPLPTWGFALWETQMSSLVKALSSEQLQQIQEFYNQLREISGIYSKLQSLMDEQQANLRADRRSDGGPIQMGVPGPPRKFDKNAPVLWDDLEQIALRLIGRGNPLPTTLSHAN